MNTIDEINTEIERLSGEAERVKQEIALGKHRPLGRGVLNRLKTAAINFDIFEITDTEIVIKKRNSKWMHIPVSALNLIIVALPIVKKLQDHFEKLQEVLPPSLWNEDHVQILGKTKWWAKKSTEIVYQPGNNAGDYNKELSKAAYIEALETELSHSPLSEAEQECLMSLIKKPEIWRDGTGKHINRGQSDWPKNAMTNILRITDQSSESHYTLLKLALDIDLLEEIDKCAKVSNGKNLILHGAPGTGKSHELEKNPDYKADQTFRTVFHAETQYVDFVGCVRPVKIPGKDYKPDDISYDFVPGPFAKALVWALQNDTKSCRLIIEEINRAPAAAAFGEIFQLLDRDPQTRESVYGITAPDLLQYVSTKLKRKDTEIKVPGNLSIYATMNNSDQNVTPLDTAFKRRWRFKYLPVTFEEKYPKGDVFDQVSWQLFAERINDKLLKKDVPEDRLLGQWFVTEEELKDPNTITEKIIPYLFNDVLRYEDVLREQIFGDSKSLSSLLKDYGDDPRKCFKIDFPDGSAKSIDDMDQDVPQE